MKIHDFLSWHVAGKKISMVTCYDYTMATIINSTTVDAVLVGDSASMVMHGHASTLPITVEQLAWHTASVARGLSGKFIVADLPFLSYRKGLVQSMEAICQLMQAGAHAVKLEGAAGNIDCIRHCVESGVPVMGHLGLTPQSLHQLGGYKVQGTSECAAAILLREAKELEQAGCFSVVLECVPAAVAAQITQALSIPTIGIGAGPDTSGQVLVSQDLLGMNADFKPTFVKRYLEGAALMEDAFNAYDAEVKAVTFPALGQHTFRDEVVTS